MCRGFRWLYRRRFPLSGDWLTWLGHASFLLRLGGLTVAVDPVLSARILGAGQRFTPPGVDRLPPLDLLLISHNHYDRAPRAQEGEADVDRVLLMRVTVQEMEVGPPEPLCRGWLQTTACCVG